MVYSVNKEHQKDLVFDGLDLIDGKGNTVAIDFSKTIVIDFWTTTCATCFKTFPDYEKVYNHYKKDENIAVLSVNVPLKKDSLPKTIELVKKLDYDFPTLYLSKTKDIEAKYHIDAFPHILIIKNDKITYNGLLETSPLIVINNLYSEINKALN